MKIFAYNLLCVTNHILTIYEKVICEICSRC